MKTTWLKTALAVAVGALSTQAMAAGTRVFWDNTNRRLTTTATGNFQVGVVTVAALAADTTVRVMLARVPASGA